MSHSIHRNLSRRVFSVSPKGLRVAAPNQCLHQSAIFRSPPAAPRSKDRGPTSDEKTQTDFSAMNILSQTPPPTTAIDTCMEDGFALGSGLRVTGAGVLLCGGEAFAWRPWEAAQKAAKGSSEGQESPAKGEHWASSPHAWGVLALAWPKPDLLILGTGRRVVPIPPAARRLLASFGVRIDVLDTRNAAAQFNLLATERGVQQIAAALLPLGWEERA